jgi:hypothetical protein
MADTIEQRDFFISFNSADLAYAEAIDAALREGGFSTFFHPNDLPDGGNIIIWMDEALMNSAQTLALFSPDYTTDKAVYSKIERYASLWQDPGSDERKLIPILLRETAFTPLIAPLKRIDITAMTRQDAAAHVVNRLKTPLETKERDRSRIGLPLPKVFNVPYRRNPNFTGRLEAMESLQNSLREGNAAITAVAGLGGVGKTTLAAEYCHRFGGRYGGVWWVRAEQESVMLSDLATLGQRLGLVATGNIEADARAALENIASRTEPWLMVYDNAANADAVAKWLPVGSVRCLITSRFAAFDGVATVTRLGQWSDEVAADYLLARTGRNDKEGALRLAHSLGGLPLAAEQAAVFLKNRKGISFDDYANELARLIKEEKPAGAKGDYPDTVYVAFVKSLEAIDGMRGGKTALDLLRLCSFLSPDGVDLSLLTVKRQNEFLLADFAAIIADKFVREDALAALVSLSLLRQEDGPIGPVLIFHRLLLEITRDWMGAVAREQWGTAALRLVSAVFPSESLEPSSWPICARLLPHVTPLDMHVPNKPDANAELDYLLNEAAVYLAVRGDDAGAIVFAEKSVELARQSRDKDPLGYATSLDNLAARNVKIGRLNDAEALSYEALTIRESLGDPNDVRLAIPLSNLAEVHQARQEFVKAEELLLRAEAVIKAAQGTESAKYGVLLNNLDSLYDDWAEQSGDISKRQLAQRYSTQALDVTRLANGPRHPETATRYHNLSLHKERMGDLNGAAADEGRAFAILLSLEMMQHGHAKSSAYHLVRLWQSSGQTDKAAKLKSGDISDLLPVTAEIETEHRAWVAEDPMHRHFGPPSPFAKN